MAYIYFGNDYVIRQTTKLKLSPNIPCIQYYFNPGDNCFKVFTLFILVEVNKLERKWPGVLQKQLTPDSSFVMKGHYENGESCTCGYSRKDG